MAGRVNGHKTMLFLGRYHCICRWGRAYLLLVLCRWFVALCRTSWTSSCWNLLYSFTNTGTWTDIPKLYIGHAASWISSIIPRDRGQAINGVGYAQSQGHVVHALRHTLNCIRKLVCRVYPDKGGVHKTPCEFLTLNCICRIKSHASRIIPLTGMILSEFRQ